MNHHLLLSVVATLIVSFVSQAEWSPDPFCPYPSDEITKYPYYGNCSIYWACLDGTRFLVECPLGQEFDSDASECDAPEIANCNPYVSTTSSSTEAQTTTTSTTTTTEPTITPATTLTTTSATTTTSSETTTSATTTTPPTTTSATTTPSVTTTTSSETTTSATTPTSAATTTGSTSTSTTSNRPDLPCPSPSEDILFFPYPGDCTKYYECFEGDSYLYHCPEGLWWHQELLECDFPGDYCDNSTASTASTTTEPTTTSATTTPSAATTTSATTSTSATSGEPDLPCPDPSEDILFYPYPGDCSKYYECFEGDSYLYHCSEGLWWHQELLECDFPGDYCSNSSASSVTAIFTTSIAPTPTSTTTTITVAPTDNPQFDCPFPSEEILFFPYSGDCNKYWECFDGEPYLYTCPPDLWWHNEVTECDYPRDYCDNAIAT